MSFVQQFRERFATKHQAEQLEEKPKSVRDVYGFEVKKDFIGLYDKYSKQWEVEERERSIKWDQFLISLLQDSAQPKTSDGEINYELALLILEKAVDYFRGVGRDTGPACTAEVEMQLKYLVQAGLPMALRGRLWKIFLGLRRKKVEGVYWWLVAKTLGQNKEGEPLSQEELDNLKDTAVYAPALRFLANQSTLDRNYKHWNDESRDWQAQIEKDLHRTFPGHPVMDTSGKHALRRILLAYSQHNPTIGYCQGMNFLAGFLLLFMEEEDAFWCLGTMVEDLLEGYFSFSMVSAQVDQHVFKHIVDQRFPNLQRHLAGMGVDISAVVSPWLICAFVNSLPLEANLRVWDVLFFELHNVVLFKVALALVDIYSKALIQTVDAVDAWTTLQTMAPMSYDVSRVIHGACISFNGLSQNYFASLRSRYRQVVIQQIHKANIKRTNQDEQLSALISQLNDQQMDPYRRSLLQSTYACTFRPTDLLATMSAAGALNTNAPTADGGASASAAAPMRGGQLKLPNNYAEVDEMNRTLVGRIPGLSDRMEMDSSEAADSGMSLQAKLGALEQQEGLVNMRLVDISRATQTAYNIAATPYRPGQQASEQEEQPNMATTTKQLFETSKQMSAGQTVKLSGAGQTNKKTAGPSPTTSRLSQDAKRSGQDTSNEQQDGAQLSTENEDGGENEVDGGNEQVQGDTCVQGQQGVTGGKEASQNDMNSAQSAGTSTQDLSLHINASQIKSLVSCMPAPISPMSVGAETQAENAWDLHVAGGGTMARESETGATSKSLPSTPIDVKRRREQELELESAHRQLKALSNMASEVQGATAAGKAAIQAQQEQPQASTSQGEGVDDVVQGEEAVLKLLSVVEKLEGELYEAERMRLAAEQVSEEVGRANRILQQRLQAMELTVSENDSVMQDLRVKVQQVTQDLAQQDLDLDQKERVLCQLKRDVKARDQSIQEKDDAIAQLMTEMNNLTQKPKEVEWDNQGGTNNSKGSAAGSIDQAHSLPLPSATKGIKAQEGSDTPQSQEGFMGITSRIRGLWGAQ